MIPSFPLFQPLESIPGVNGSRKALFKKLLGPRVVDALFHLPSQILCYKYISTLSQAEKSHLIFMDVEVIDHVSPKKKGHPHKVHVSDGKEILEIIYFNLSSPYLKKMYPVGGRKRIRGKVDFSLSKTQMIHPDCVEDIPSLSPPSLIREVIYPLCRGITNTCVQRVIRYALSKVPLGMEWMEEDFLHKQGWSSWRNAILSVHTPQAPEDLTLYSKDRQRLAFDELLSHQLGLQLVRQYKKHQLKGMVQKGTGHYIDALLSVLPFQLTPSQHHVVQEIFEDMSLDAPMSRLIQGDVGSGKTIVAFLAMLRAIESGNQAAILAPTDILARQHAATIGGLSEKLGIRTALLTAREKGKTKTALLKKLTEGEIDLVIGTHAVIEEKVAFKNLGIAVVDEQHRFGVKQRGQLGKKGMNPDLLVMTATPIPRTLQLAQYGDMDISIIRGKPAGRLPIQTKILSVERVEEVIFALHRSLTQGTKAFWVCPLIKESETLQLCAVEDRFDTLKKEFGGHVGLVHSQMKGEEKDKVMDHFTKGNVTILVATTVIEVGIHVPEATLMIIEHAEHFGLAQLHQLRGRIGRGEKGGVCLLLYGQSLSPSGKKRLETMRETEDGFKIAEADLKLRGGGDILGTRQSGMPTFKVADISEFPDICQSLLSLAHEKAKQMSRGDPVRQQTIPFWFLLNVFGQEESMEYIRS